MGRWGDGEMGRWGDGEGEMGRWGDGEMGRWESEKSSGLTFRLNIDRLNPLNPLENPLPNLLKRDRPRQIYRHRLR
ncbi:MULTISPECIES: hypothetical protein [unclassified Microcoleus]|uniref:hypothetical protein n=1 Tax=unclassified Microcoleus TaxID=2642155 RepID=UPI002FD47BD7